MFSYLWNKHCSELLKDVEMTEDEAKIVADVIIESYDEILRRIRENQQCKGNARDVIRHSPLLTIR